MHGFRKHFLGLTTAAAMTLSVLAAPLGAQAAPSIDPKSLVTYTGAGWYIDVPTGWAPEPGFGVAGDWPGTPYQAGVTVDKGDPNGKGLDELVAKDLADAGKSVTILNKKGVAVDGQTALQADFAVPGDNGAPPIGVGRVSLWIEDGNYWAVVFVVVGTGDPVTAGLDAFTNQILPTFDFD
jgi:hypothetical protein